MGGIEPRECDHVWELTGPPSALTGRALVCEYRCGLCGAVAFTDAAEAFRLDET